MSTGNGDDIDTSDIPEQGAAFFANATRKRMTPRNSIANQNDRFRAALGSTGELKGHLAITQSVAAFGHDFIEEACKAVKRFSDFTPGDDPYGEHDFGAFTLSGQRLHWKIDYYDSDACEYGSAAKHDPAQTYRVIIIMLASDY